ncbi:MAG: hypothetical protein IJ323_01665 [Clostridia bacterium]|nr:hypothetical protein [Clostridia bacterium]
MGGGFGAKGTSFGNTKGSALDAISNLLTAASFIPGIDTFTNLASIPVDLLRGDYISAGLDFVGAIPFIGEVADVAKTADKVSDTVKAIDKIADASKGDKGIIKVPKSPAKLTRSGWKEITPDVMKKKTTSRTFKKNGLTIRFDKGKKGAGGYGGKDHYHILNPNSTGKHDYYLDKYGNPVPKNSKASHILP